MDRDRTVRRLANGVKTVTVLAVICQLLASVYCWPDAAIKTPQSDILLITMGGTRSHKIPFIALAKGLIAKGHQVTLLSGYLPSERVAGLEEIVPEKFRQAVAFYDDFDYLGIRIRNEYWQNIKAVVHAGNTFCSGLLADPATKELLSRKFDLVVIDSYYIECSIGLTPTFKAPFMYLNTMTNYMNNIALSGNPVPWSITPFFTLPFTNDMSFLQRITNAFHHVFAELLKRYMAFLTHRIQKRFLGKEIPHPLKLARNVSFILQNGHVTVSHNQPFLPNVAQIGCIQCRPAQPLPQLLNDYLDEAGDQGFVYVSMGTSVNPKTMPPETLAVILSAFRQLPYRILWKFDANLGQLELPPNVRIENWLPQQDVLGHRNIKAFVTHSGMFGTQEIVYHGVPVVTLPVFADQDSNAIKVVQEGYGIQLELRCLTVAQLVEAVTEVATNPKYKAAAKRAQNILRDQPMTPLEAAVFWSEYVIRHKGASQFSSPGRYLNWIQYYGYDIALLCVAVLIGIHLMCRMFRDYSIRIICGNGNGFPTKEKLV